MRAAPEQVTNSGGSVNLARLLVIHAIVTLAAAAVLVIAPDLIPGAVGVDLDPSAHLMSYLLGTAELAIAALSFGAARLKDPQALRLVCSVLIVFHLSTAAVEGYAYIQGASARIWGNVAIRVVVAALFAYYRASHAHPSSLLRCRPSEQ
jgi:hypothetical protein